MTVGFEMRLAKSFSRYNSNINYQMKLGYGATFVCFIIIPFTILAVFKPYLCHPPTTNLLLSMRGGMSMLMMERKSTPQPLALANKKMHKSMAIICSYTEPRSDNCEMQGDIRLQGNSSNIFFIPSPQTDTVWAGNMNASWKIKPYARKGDPSAMGRVTELSLRPLAAGNFVDAPNCTVNHSSPAIIFSVTGYTGNLFHDFTDVLIPLFITSRQFDGDVQFVITDSKPWWVRKYEAILKQLSRHEAIDHDKDSRVVRCFPRAIVGLRSHKEMGIDPSRSPHGYSMADFRAFLRSTYSLERKRAVRIGDGKLEKKPRLLIISRKRTRRFTNEGEVVETAERLGMEVVTAEARVQTRLSDFARIVNSCDVMMGIHGAGLTNLVFLPTNAVVIQVVPLGGLEWHARLDFGGPSEEMELRYLEYRIGEEESSLIEQYPRDHPVIRDPMSIHKKGWLALRSAYLDKQDVRLDVSRFKNTLLEALELLRQ